MSRRSIGPRPLTVAERQARLRIKRQAHRDMALAALQAVLQADKVTEARRIAREALTAISGGAKDTQHG